MSFRITAHTWPKGAVERGLGPIGRRYPTEKMYPRIPTPSLGSKKVSKDLAEISRIFIQNDENEEKKNELNRNRKMEKLTLASFHKIPSDYAARQKFIDKIARLESILAALDMVTESILGVWVGTRAKDHHFHRSSRDITGFHPKKLILDPKSGTTKIWRGVIWSGLTGAEGVPF